MRTGRGDWREIELGELCELKYGKSLPDSMRNGGEIPVYGSNGIVGSHDSAATPGPTIIVGRKGSLGEVKFSTVPCWPIDTTYYIDESCTTAELKWLAYRLAALRLTDLNRAAAIPGLNREDAYRLRLLVPPLSEQRRIAEVLDRAEALRAKRRATLAELDALKKGFFREIFECSPANEWPVVPVADLARSRDGGIRTGPFGSQLLHSEFVDDGIAVLGIDNVVANEFQWGERRFITEPKFRQLQRYRVYPGDVLITIMGTCGRCVVVPDDVPTAITTKHLCSITVDREKCLPTFLQAYFLWHPVAEKYLGRSAKGAIMSGLNMGIIKEMPVWLPPISVQRDFERRAEGVARLKVTQRASLAELDALFASLQHRAFRGEL